MSGEGHGEPVQSLDCTGNHSISGETSGFHYSLSMTSTSSGLRPLVQLGPASARLALMLVGSSGAETGCFVGRTFPQAELIASKLMVATGIQWFSQSAHKSARGWIGEDGIDLLLYDSRVDVELVDLLARVRLRERGRVQIPEPIALEVR